MTTPHHVVQYTSEQKYNQKKYEQVVLEGMMGI